MNKTPEYNAYVEWAKDAPLSMLVDAIAEYPRYPAVIRDELRARLKPTPGLTVTDLLWDQFEKAKSAQAAIAKNHDNHKEQEGSDGVPGSFLRHLRENKDFWRWALSKGQAVFENDVDSMWRKCFDLRLTETPRTNLTSGELGLIATFSHALRDYTIEKEHDFQAFIHS